MPWLDIEINAEGMLKGIPNDQIIVAKNDSMKIGVLPNGMKSGNHSVSFGIYLPDGKMVFAETSLKLFLTAARVFAAKYGEPE